MPQILVALVVLATLSAWVCFCFWSALGLTDFVVLCFVLRAYGSVGSYSSSFVVYGLSEPIV